MPATDFVALTHTSPVLVALRVLRDEYRRGRITLEEHRAAWRTLMRGEGEPCVACLIGTALVALNGRELCGACALAEAAYGH